jgi:hypothetical protein
VKLPLLVQSKVTENKLFWPLRNGSDAYAAHFGSLKIRAAIGSGRDETPEFPGLKTASVSSAHAATGASEPSIQRNFGGGFPKIRRSSLVAGRRGDQERNCVSSEFISFITSFQLEF